ncbi:MAG: 5'-nucleotidase C-terminal domain-containing protein [Lachnospiraceae bacterium]|nr:5'-nucleotidase C-terminal domain-containing protein [Lachnospiraceae bacterium]
MTDKSKLNNKIICALLTFCMMLVMISFSPLQAMAEDNEDKSEDIVILYTNDIHTYIDGDLSYDTIAAIKAELSTQYKYVFLMDAGDHIQGTAYGSMDKGETIIKLMNAAGYDVATLGNHEFDYGMFGCMNVVDKADFPYVSCNFYHESNGVRKENVLDSYVTFDCGDESVAVIGVTTPESFTKSTPAYFQDEEGNYIYGIAGGINGDLLYADVQAAIDEARSKGATKVIVLGHLGDGQESSPWTSEETIANVTGLDAFIDGHSHSTVKGKTVLDKSGEGVLLTQTGEYFNRIGIMVIDSDTGEITTDFIEYEEAMEYGVDEDVKAIKDDWIEEIDSKLETGIGSTTVTFDNYDEEGNRLVRSKETNTGDFAADALYYLFDNMGMDVDVAIMNGGGIRNTAITGELTYKTCKEIHTFGNVACLQTITGQQLLDALEWGARFAKESENGGFLQVSGITYKIDCSVPDTTQKDDKGVWIGGPTGDYRVYDVKVYNKTTNSWDALDLDATYNLAGYNYTLRDLGDGFSMFEGAENVLDYVMEDYMALSNYVNGFSEGKVEATNSPLMKKYPNFNVDYSTVDGSGRIEINPYKEGKIVIGGLDNDTWISKHGNVYLSCTVADFLGEMGYEMGDMVTVRFLDEEITVPVVPSYFYVDSGESAIIAKEDENGNPTGNLSLAINMGNFAEAYGIAVKKTDESGAWWWEATEGARFPVEVTFEMAEEDGYKSEYLLRQLTRTNNRSDYPQLTDEEFANFRLIGTTGIGEGKLYRTSSPINPELGRNEYAMAALEEAGVTVIMNLADNKESARGYEGFEDSYYANQKVIYLCLGMDFNSEEFKAGLAKGLIFFAENDGTYAIHCNEGKDRAGFVAALLECFTGATYEEIVEDYMITYSNYYGVKPDSDKYQAIAKSNIIKTLCEAFGVEDLSKADLQKEAEEYIRSLGLSDSEIANLKTNLTDSGTLEELPEDNPQTGDEGCLSIYFSLMCISLIMMGCMHIRKETI